MIRSKREIGFGHGYGIGKTRMMASREGQHGIGVTGRDRVERSGVVVVEGVLDVLGHRSHHLKWLGEIPGRLEHVE